MEGPDHMENPNTKPTLRPHQKKLVGFIVRIAKRASPFLGFLVRLRPGLATYAVMYTEMLLGKGAGAGWDMGSESAVALRFLNGEQPVVFDVGAHDGSWSQEILSVHPDATLIQFEPNPDNLVILNNQQLANVEVVGAAVSDKEGTTSFFAASTTDLGSVHRRRESIFQDRTYSEIEVETVTLDKFLKERRIRRVDFMKMDIEGHELQALAGASEALASGCFRTISFEFGSGNINSRTFFHDFWDLLTPLGYKLYRVCPGAWLLPVSGYYEDLEYFRNVTNYIATLEPMPAK